MENYNNNNNEKVAAATSKWYKEAAVFFCVLSIFIHRYPCVVFVYYTGF